MHCAAGNRGQVGGCTLWGRRASTVLGREPFNPGWHGAVLEEMEGIGRVRLCCGKGAAAGGCSTGHQGTALGEWQMRWDVRGANRWGES